MPTDYLINRAPLLFLSENSQVRPVSAAAASSRHKGVSFQWYPWTQCISPPVLTLTARRPWLSPATSMAEWRARRQRRKVWASAIRSNFFRNANDMPDIHYNHHHNSSPCPFFGLDGRASDLSFRNGFFWLVLLGILALAILYASAISIFFGLTTSCLLRPNE